MGAGGRPRLRTGAAPETIRVLTAALDARIIPDTYVSDGAPVVVEQVSGAAGPTAGDDDVVLPLSSSTLKPELLAGLLAHHTDVVQSKVNEKGDTHDVEVSPPAAVLAAVPARQSWPGLPVPRRIISTPVLHQTYAAVIAGLESEAHQRIERALDWDEDTGTSK
ncbi:hypothetical protein QRX50_26805 [Amycolatopsis carbonis]|uniref:Uncharacterized protein n=1 Tax=Amycolatopsis carbonis TaxID=715471 RepID=A0A9Y2I8X5_9PSEU|nr:hypothetical protein [Amycolatopsis sp. 2-15]WIX75154.1 hypothetical protein QRX50_26805 [Amycolatopsis sp. 2-15]